MSSLNSFKSSSVQGYLANNSPIAQRKCPFATQVPAHARDSWHMRCPARHRSLIPRLIPTASASKSFSFSPKMVGLVDAIVTHGTRNSSLWKLSSYYCKAQGDKLLYRNSQEKGEMTSLILFPCQFKTVAYDARCKSQMISSILYRQQAPRLGAKQSW